MATAARKTFRLIDELQPSNQAELDQVCQAARLRLAIERADRFEIAEGCRWLLARWAEFRILPDCGVRWDTPALLRFIRLQGKQVAESVYDPALNVLDPGAPADARYAFQTAESGIRSGE